MRSRFVTSLILFVCILASCVDERESYPNGQVKRGSVKLLQDSAGEVKPFGVTLYTGRATLEDGSEKGYEDIDTDGDGKGDFMWFPDGQAKGIGVGAPYVPK